MPILSNSNKVSTTSFFGGYLDPKLLRYVHLFCLAEGITKTDVIKKMAKDWRKKKQKEHPEAELFNKIIDMVQAEYEVTDYDHETFVKKIKRELDQKNIDPVYINGIIDGFEESLSINKNKKK